LAELIFDQTATQQASSDLLLKITLHFLIISLSSYSFSASTQGLQATGLRLTSFSCAEPCFKMFLKKCICYIL